MDSKNSEKTESKIRQMNIFPIYILAMLLRAWFFSGEGNTKLIHILCKAKSFQFNWNDPGIVSKARYKDIINVTSNIGYNF